MVNKHEHKVAEHKIRKVQELADFIKDSNTIMIVSIKSLPSKQFQDIKKRLRDKAKIIVAKKSIINHALEKAGKSELRELESFVLDGTAILFSKEDAFEISKILSEQTSPAFAKAGQEAPEDITVPAGPTSLVPGPDISALSSLGIQSKVENGKITITEEKVICQKGEKINEAKSSLLAKLDIAPFHIGIVPIAAFSEGKLYKDVKIDVEETLNQIIDAFKKALAFAVEISYPTRETLDFLLAKASIHEKAIENLLQTQTKSQTE